MTTHQFTLNRITTFLDGGRVHFRDKADAIFIVRAETEAGAVEAARTISAPPDDGFLHAYTLIEVKPA